MTAHGRTCPRRPQAQMLKQELPSPEQELRQQQDAHDDIDGETAVHSPAAS
jgi:hypothetical protein